MLPPLEGITHITSVCLTPLALGSAQSVRLPMAALWGVHALSTVSNITKHDCCLQEHAMASQLIHKFCHVFIELLVDTNDIRVERERRFSTFQELSVIVI